MSKSSKIIVGGCSFTDKFYPYTTKPLPHTFKMWPELLSDKTNIEVINTAKCGIGNERIFHSVIAEIFNNENIERVIVAWTEWTRQDFLVNNNWVTLKPNLKVSATCKPKYGVYDLHELQNWYNNAFGSSYPTPENIVNKNINLFYSLYAICKSRDIELKMFQMINAFNRYQIKDNDYEHDIKIAQKSMISNPISTEINEDMFWGWPVFGKLGGIELVRHLDRNNKYHAISDVDHHPNEETQKNIMEFIYENIF